MGILVLLGFENFGLFVYWKVFQVKTVAVMEILFLKREVSVKVILCSKHHIQNLLTPHCVMTEVFTGSSSLNVKFVQVDYKR